MRSPAARRSLAVLALLTALALGLGAGAGAGAIDGASADSSQPAANGTESPTTMRIVLQPDGDARWTVTVRFALETANKTRGFDRLADSFEEGDADAPSVDEFRRAAALAGEATGRPMAIRNVSRTAGRSDGVGRLALSFTWTSFARTSEDRLVLGDAFRTESGTWLPRIHEGQELVVVFPPRHEVQSSSRALKNGTFHIEGPARLTPGEPSATLVRSRPITTGGPAVTTTDGGGTTSRRSDGTTSEPPGGAIQPAIGMGIAGLVLIAALAGYLVWRRGTGGDDGEAPSGVERPPSDDPAASAASAASVASASSGAESTDGSGAPVDGDQEPLLSDEERVLRLLHENEGRMKQAAIVDETDWSNAKVSQLLSEMDERDLVDKLRIGRENLISLPDETIDEFE